MNTEDRFSRELTALLPRLRRFAHGLSRDAADADDLTQTTVERALRSRDRWTPGTNMVAWLFRIMRNIWIDTARSRMRASRHEAPPEAGEAAGHDPRPATETAIDASRAMQAMAQLPDEQREVLALVLIEGFGYREAAELLDLPIGTVSSRLVRGRIALLALLGGEQANDG